MLVLEHTSDWEILRYCQSRNYPTWGQPFTLTDYQEREEINYKHELCDIMRDYSKKKKGVYYWIMRDSEADIERSSNPKFQNIVSACEILVRDSYFVDASSNDKTDIQECLSAVIGSVFTFPEYRSRGYATKMLKLLVDKMKILLGNPYDFSFLYSEVGEFYSKFGFKSYYEPLCVIQVGSHRTKVSYKYTELTTDFHAQMELYDERLKRLMKKHAQKENKLVVSLKPEQNIIEWFLNRSRFSARALKGFTDIRTKELVFGAKLDTETNDFIIWFDDFRENTAVVLLLYADSLENVKKLVDICKFHIPNEMNKIIFWETELYDFDKSGESRNEKEIQTFVKDQLGCETGLENGSLSALRMLKETVNSQRDTIWEGNGKWAWF
ncbi:hypothetical protein FOA43_003549 [Brettanomyces nanus]|uniref:N-acetyltransferase domain-containing protein n=1 Tax=Eeniella nana TaxID=13502 RepID=A0A875S5G0_EENNA|nr:uncharacterized protein FOA43_003549 [Brettanomyces nanus]QPG76163.1 hypothetical protein FOA43_003549 [Brettanomyces nanus]